VGLLRLRLEQIPLRELPSGDKFTVTGCRTRPSSFTRKLQQHRSFLHDSHVHAKESFSLTQDIIGSQLQRLLGSLPSLLHRYCFIFHWNNPPLSSVAWLGDVLKLETLNLGPQRPSLLFVSVGSLFHPVLAPWAHRGYGEGVEPLAWYESLIPIRGFAIY